MYYPLLFRCAVPSAPPDVNKDWTHGAVHSHTLTLQSSTSHLQSFTTFTPLLLLRAPPLFSSPSLDINLWLSTCHLHYYAGLVQQSRALFMDFCCRTGFPAGALALLVCFFFANWPNLQRNPVIVSVWSARCRGLVLFSVSAVVFSFATRCF